MRVKKKYLIEWLLIILSGILIYFFVDNDASDIAKKIDMIRLDHAIDGNEGRRWVVENFDSPLIWKEIEEKLYKS